MFGKTDEVKENDGIEKLDIEISKTSNVISKMIYKYF